MRGGLFLEVARYTVQKMEPRQPGKDEGMAEGIRRKAETGRCSPGGPAGMILGAAGAILMECVERAIHVVGIRIHKLENWGNDHVDSLLLARDKPQHVFQAHVFTFVVVVPPMLGMLGVIWTLYLCRAMMVLSGISCRSLYP